MDILEQKSNLESIVDYLESAKIDMGVAGKQWDKYYVQVEEMIGLAESELEEIEEELLRSQAEFEEESKRENALLETSYWNSQF